MSRRYQDEENFIYNGPLTCQCAMSFGSYQSVALSNIIEASPLFYYEDETDFSDEEFLELEELRNELLDGLERENAKERHLKSKNATKHLEQYQKLSLEKLYFENKKTLFEDDEKSLDLDEVLSKISTSKMGRFLLDFAISQKVDIAVSNQVENSFYDRDGQKIFVHSDLSEDRAVLLIVKNLREVWLHRQGVLIHPLTFQPEDAILLNRIFTVDAVSTQIRVAWEMKLSGEEGPWMTLIGGAAYDLASAFAKEAITDFRSISSGKAQRASFESWFVSGRCKTTDRALIQQMLADQHGLVFSANDISKTATIEIIAAMGEMPYGKNYLGPLMENISEDPFYTEIRDRSNANFLWFIKFEQSFRDSEQELQSESSPNGKATAYSAHSDKGSDHVAKPQVIHFDSRKQTTSARHAEDDNGNAPATIYYIEHFQPPSKQSNF